ncbi:MAG TPA: cytochrome c [Candidatus Binatia bacterium]
MHRTSFTVLLTGMFLLSLSPWLTAQEDPISDRQNLMKSNNKISRSLKNAVKEKDFAAIQAGAKTLMANAEKIPALFPKGSLGEKSKATKAVWDDFDGFKQHAGWLKKGAEGLAAAAASKDAEMVGLEYDAVNSACNQCHRDYRKSLRKGSGKKKK